MPYLVTTTTPDLSTEIARRDRRVTGGTEHVTRRAVATLDEARSAVRFWLGTELTERVQTQCDDVFAHDGTGEGTIGPLPDGTTIVVAQTTWQQLANDAGRLIEWRGDVLPDQREQILDAFNASV